MSLRILYRIFHTYCFSCLVCHTSNSFIENDTLLNNGSPPMNKMKLKKTPQLSKNQYVSLVKRLTDDDRNPNVEQIEKIRKAVRTPKKNSR
jgi:hypothetical protein